MQLKQLQQFIVKILEELKAEEITVLDIHKLTAVTDIMIICNGRSSRHIHSIAENLVEKAKQNGIRLWWGAIKSAVFLGRLFPYKLCVVFLPFRQIKWLFQPCFHASHHHKSVASHHPC